MTRAGAAALVVLAGLAAVACDRSRDVPLEPVPPRLIAPPDPSTFEAATASPVNGGYLGGEACAECHAERVEAVKQTAHWQASAKVTAGGLRAGDPAGAVVRTPGALRLELDVRDDELWQVAVDDARDERLSRRMDVVIGSGKIAQTFLTWEKDRLYELPMTWFAQVGWRFSPGYWEDRADFSRPVYGQCLECHTTWAQAGHAELVHDNAFVGTVLWGVTCEKCHGPAAEHAAWMRAHPSAPKGERKIVVPSDLARERRDDVCLLCHQSRGEDVKPVFTFRPGDVLREHYAAAGAPAEGGPVALHVFDQGDRLHASRCFQESGTMACITCHNPHRNERGDDAAFSARCMACHEAAELSQKNTAAAHDGKTECLDCHMPKRATEADRRGGGGAEARATMRDHRIGVYAAGGRDR